MSNECLFDKTPAQLRALAKLYRGGASIAAPEDIPEMLRKAEECELLADEKEADE